MTLHVGVSADGTLKMTNQRDVSNAPFTVHWLKPPLTPWTHKHTHTSFRCPCLCLISWIIAVRSNHVQCAFRLVIRSYQVWFHCQGISIDCAGIGRQHTSSCIIHTLALCRLEQWPSLWRSINRYLKLESQIVLPLTHVGGIDWETETGCWWRHADDKHGKLHFYTVTREKVTVWWLGLTNISFVNYYHVIKPHGSDNA